MRDAPPGESDRRLSAALAGPVVSRSELCAALVDAQVLVAVAATATGYDVAGADGLRGESGAELAVLLIEASDGSRALPVFTDVAALQRWRLDARPVKLTGAQACAAALDEGAVQLLIDPASTAAALDQDELSAVAAGWVPVTGSSLRSRTGDTTLVAPSGPVPPELVRALQHALAPERVTARLLEGGEGLVVGVSFSRVLDPAALAALAQRVMARLGPSLPVAGLGLAQVGDRGPGLPLVRRSRLTGRVTRLSS